MPKINKEVIKGYIDASKDKLDSAEVLFRHKKYEDAISRAYYAIFHCAQVLLLSIGVKAESHSGVRQLFGLHFIKKGKLDKKLGRYLRHLKDDRENGDYGIFTLLDRKDAQKAIKEAQEFIISTEQYLKEKNHL